MNRASLYRKLRCHRLSKQQTQFHSNVSGCVNAPLASSSTFHPFNPIQPSTNFSPTIKRLRHTLNINVSSIPTSQSTLLSSATQHHQPVHHHIHFLRRATYSPNHPRRTQRTNTVRWHHLKYSALPVPLISNTIQRRYINTSSSTTPAMYMSNTSRADKGAMCNGFHSHSDKHNANGIIRNHAKNSHTVDIHSSALRKQLRQDNTLSTSTSTATFNLDPTFISQYANRHPPFGFNGLGELVYRRTYSRKLDDGSGDNEQWYQTVARVVIGTYRMQEEWIRSRGLLWNESKAQHSAQEMYKRIYEMKFLPPGRGLWAMGSTITEKRKLYAALNNCAFVSTMDMASSPERRTASKPFKFLMDASMLGVGVGFDTRGAGSVMIKGPEDEKHGVEHFQIADSREGWVDSTEAVLHSYFYGGPPVIMDYSLIRPFGTPIKGFGGLASGPAALKELHDNIWHVLNPRIGSAITLTDIVDIMNFIGKCVVAGNVRRTAEIAFGDPHNSEYLDLKNYQKNPHRAAYGWTSNNSVFADLGMDYSEICKRIVDNGEPGLAWLHNMSNYGRMNQIRLETEEPADSRDYRASGGNPCLEQTLESFEMCCLVETFPTRHESLEDYLITLKYAYLYAKTVTLGKTEWPETNAVMQRNRRIGCSVSGIAQFLTRYDLHTLQRWLDTGYKRIQALDQRFSEWLVIPKSIKTTSVKPSGTVSLLAGATPGMHYPESRYYLRRVRLSHISELLPPLKAAGYHIEDSVGDPNTVIVEIPVDVGHGVRTVKEVPMWEQLSLAAFLQRHWADNQVSCTVTFDPESEGDQLVNALNYFQYELKGVSFLPRMKLGAYPQMPYEEIDRETYESKTAGLKPLHFEETKTSFQDATPDRFCDGDVCSVPPAIPVKDATYEDEDGTADMPHNKVVADEPSATLYAPPVSPQKLKKPHSPEEMKETVIEGTQNTTPKPEKDSYFKLS